MEHLHKSFFALPNNRKYPLHTKEATLKSFSAFLKEKEALEPHAAQVAEENFNKAGAYHGIDLKAIQEARSCFLTKKAAETRPETISFKSDGLEITMTKVSCEEQFKQAVKHVLEKRASTPRSMLKAPALYLCGVSEALGIDVDTPEMRKIAKIAGIGVGDQREIEHELLKRGSLIEIPTDARSAFYELHRNLHDMGENLFYKQANLEKMCSLLEGIDRLYNLEQHYGRDLQRPEDVCFKHGIDDMLKEASDLFLIPSIDATLSKTALLERENSANDFFSTYYGMTERLSGDALIAKVASLGAAEAEMFLDKVR